MRLHKEHFYLITIFALVGCVSPYEFFSGKKPPQLTQDQIRTKRPLALHIGQAFQIRYRPLKNIEATIEAGLPNAGIIIPKSKSRSGWRVKTKEYYSSNLSYYFWDALSVGLGLEYFERQGHRDNDDTVEYNSKTISVFLPIGFTPIEWYGLSLSFIAGPNLVLSKSNNYSSFDSVSKDSIEDIEEYIDSLYTHIGLGWSF